MVLSIPALAAMALPLCAQAPGAGGGEGLEWNQWRGPNRDGLSPDTGLLTRWPGGGPPLAWKTTGLGQGFSSVSFTGDRIFTMGDSGGAARLFALNAENGVILWSTAVGRPGGERNRGPRATPSTDGTLVFTLGHDGDLACVEAATGRLRWKKNLRTDFGGEMMSRWGYAESPLLDRDHVICTPGGPRGAVLALDKTTGEVAWRCTEFTDAAAYSSLVPAVIGGVSQYIVLTGESVAGIEAEGGSLLWRRARRGVTAVCATPVYRDGYLFVTSAYNVGCNAFQIIHADGGFRVRNLYAGRQLQNHHGGVVLVGDYVYGFGRRNLKCIELTTGRVVWENRSVGKGSITYADGHLVVRGEGGRREIGLVQATPEGYVETGRFNQPDRSYEPSWAHPVVFGGKLYIRDQGVLLCYDVSAN